MRTFLFLITLFVMDASTILNAVEAYLLPLMAENKGSLVVAETLEDAIEMLQVAPAGWRAILTMDGDAPNENINSAGLTTAQLVAYVQAPSGMELPRRSLSHANRRDATPSFFARRDWVIRKIRGLKLLHQEIDSTPRTFEYKGSVWFKIQNLPAFRTQACTFEITYALDNPETDPNGTDPIILPTAFRIVAAYENHYVIAFNGVTNGRVPRYEPGLDDPTGTATGYAITGTVEGGYAVAFDGVPHGRIPRFEVA